MAAYKEVRANMSEGLRFYMSLQEAIAVLAQQAGDYIMTRRLQRLASLPRNSTTIPKKNSTKLAVPGRLNISSILKDIVFGPTEVILIGECQSGCILTETMV